MSQYDPNLDPNRIPPSQPVYTETIETVVVRPESNTGWWIAGGLAAAVLIAVIWILASGGRDDTETELRLAEAEAAAAQANADQAIVQGQINGAQQSVDFARVDAARAQADAMRASSEARAAEARAERNSRPVIITTPAPQTIPPAASVVTTTTPQQ